MSDDNEREELRRRIDALEAAVGTLRGATDAAKGASGGPGETKEASRVRPCMPPSADPGALRFPGRTVHAAIDESRGAMLAAWRDRASALEAALSAIYAAARNDLGADAPEGSDPWLDEIRARSNDDLHVLGDELGGYVATLRGPDAPWAELERRLVDAEAKATSWAETTAAATREIERLRDALLSEQAKGAFVEELGQIVATLRPGTPVGSRRELLAALGLPEDLRAAQTLAARQAELSSMATTGSPRGTVVIGPSGAGGVDLSRVNGEPWAMVERPGLYIPEPLARLLDAVGALLAAMAEERPALEITRRGEGAELAALLMFAVTALEASERAALRELWTAGWLAREAGLCPPVELLSRPERNLNPENLSEALGAVPVCECPGARARMDELAAERDAACSKVTELSEALGWLAREAGLCPPVELHRREAKLRDDATKEEAS